jgi:predicted PurR-regulated permease PerM
MKSYLTRTNVILSLSVLALICFIWAISDILLPFILAFVLAYILHPFVERLCAKRAGRGLATGLVEGLFCLIIIQ